MFDGFPKYREWLGWIFLAVAVWVYIFINTPKISRIEFYDLDSSGVEEKFELANGTLQIWTGDKLIFSSKPEYFVDNYAIGDSNNDGVVELNMGFWRTGDYGKDFEYAKTRRDPLKSYHLYLYQLMPNGTALKLVWGSSTLNDPLFSFYVKAVTDNTYMLSVETGSYADYDRYGQIRPLETSDWMWNGWWFSKQDQ